jgi:hypothetical protein
MQIADHRQTTPHRLADAGQEKDMTAFHSYGEKPIHNHVACTCPLHEIYVRRETFSPTVRISHTKDSPVGYSLTPYHLAEQLGIKIYTLENLTISQTAEVAFERAMDVHYSVVSYLWALRYYGIDPIILAWPRPLAPGQVATIDGFENVWCSATYRPSYAMIALMRIASSDTEWLRLRGEFLALKPEQRVPTLKRLAAWYLQNPSDAFGPNGFHNLTMDFGIEVNP